MNRARAVFLLIIAAAALFVVVVIALGGATVGAPGGGQGGVVENLPPGTVRVLVASANTKQRWMDAMAEQFNASGATLSTGERVVVEIWNTGSGPSHEAILNGESQPAAWSPSNQVWVDMLNQDWRDRYNRALITESCPATTSIPLGVAMWRPMAEALGWPDQPVGWADLVALATDPQGWASLGHPEWGAFRFGHGHPEHSNSGRLTIVAEIHAATGETEALTLDEVNSPQARNAVAAIEQAVYHYGEIDTDLLNRMVQRGARYLHAVSNYEGNVIRWNQEYGPQGTNELEFPLVLIYPSDGMFWESQPYCILNNAAWVTSQQIEGAALFRDFILRRENLAQLVQFGIRPADESIPLTGGDSPIRLENGANPAIRQADVVTLPYPSQDVLQGVIDMWQTVKKPSTVVMLIDVSGSMDGEPIRSAREGAQEFINQMNPRDEIVVITFNHEVLEFQPSGEVGAVGEVLRQRISGLIADGGTALHQAVIRGIERVNALRAEDLANGEQRIYGLVLLSDGENYASDGVTESQMLAALPDGTESNEARLYTIAYGDEANETLLTTLANRTNGKFFTSTPQNIRDIYFLISSEF